MFKPEGFFYIMWTSIIFICETWLALEWARFAVFPLPGWSELEIIIFFEIIVFFDILSEFFQAYKEEGNEYYEMNFDVISTRYLKSTEFLVRILTFIPWGILGEVFEYPNMFKLLWLIRAYKITMSLEILGPKFISRLLHSQAEARLERLLEREQKMSIDEKQRIRYTDQIQSEQKIIGLYAGRICKLAVIFVLLAYYIGLSWYWIAEIFQKMIYGVNEEMFY